MMTNTNHQTQQLVYHIIQSNTPKRARTNGNLRCTAGEVEGICRPTRSQVGQAICGCICGIARLDHAANGHSGWPSKCIPQPLNVLQRHAQVGPIICSECCGRTQGSRLQKQQIRSTGSLPRGGGGCKRHSRQVVAVDKATRCPTLRGVACRLCEDGDQALVPHQWCQRVGFGNGVDRAEPVVVTQKHGAIVGDPFCDGVEKIGVMSDTTSCPIGYTSRLICSYLSRLLVRYGRTIELGAMRLPTTACWLSFLLVLSTDRRVNGTRRVDYVTVWCLLLLGACIQPCGRKCLDRQRQAYSHNALGVCLGGVVRSWGVSKGELVFKRAMIFDAQSIAACAWEGVSA